MLPGKPHGVSGRAQIPVIGHWACTIAWEVGGVVVFCVVRACLVWPSDSRRRLFKVVKKRWLATARVEECCSTADRNLGRISLKKGLINVLKSLGCGWSSE